jgi:hypothetical protein
MAEITVKRLKEFTKSNTTYDEWLYDEAIPAGQSYLRGATARDWTEVTAATSASARSFRPEQGCEVLGIDDAASITSVVENGVTLTEGTDYVAGPANNLVDGEWRPTTHLIRYGQAWYSDGPKLTVVVTAKWGWSTMPPEWTMAQYVAAKAYLEARDVSFGLIALEGGGATGQRDVKAVRDFINKYRKLAAWGA